MFARLFSRKPPVPPESERPSQPYGEHDPRRGESVARFRERIDREREWCDRSDNRLLVLDWEIAQAERSLKGHRQSLDHARSQLDACHDLSPFWAARIEADLDGIRKAEATIVGHEAELVRTWPWRADEVAFTARGTRVITRDGRPYWEPAFWGCVVDEGPCKGAYVTIAVEKMRHVRPYSDMDPDEYSAFIP